MVSTILCPWSHPTKVIYILLCILTSEQFGQYASKRPHVYGHAVPRTHHHLWRAVEPRLDIRVHPLVLVAGTAKVDHLEANKNNLLHICI